MSKSTEKSIMRSLLIIVPGAFVLVVAVTATNKWPSIRAYRQQREERVKYVLPPVTSTLKSRKTATLMPERVSTIPERKSNEEGCSNRNTRTVNVIWQKRPFARSLGRSQS